MCGNRKSRAISHCVSSRHLAPLGTLCTLSPYRLIARWTHVVDSSERSSCQLVEPQGCPPRGSAGLLFGFLAWTDHSDRNCCSGPLLWPGCGDGTGDVVIEGDAGRHRREGCRGNAGKRKPSRGRRARNRPWDRSFAVRSHRRCGAVEGRAQRRMGSRGVQGERAVALRPQLRIVVRRRAGTWFPSSRLAPRNGRLGCRRKVRRSLPARRHTCISSACWCRSLLWRSYSP